MHNYFLGSSKFFTFHFSLFLVPLHAESSATVCRWCLRHERKVRAAQDTPLVKVPAIGDSRSWEKRMTACGFVIVIVFVIVGKGEKVV